MKKEELDFTENKWIGYYSNKQLLRCIGYDCDICPLLKIPIPCATDFGYKEIKAIKAIYDKKLSLL